MSETVSDSAKAAGSLNTLALLRLPPDQLDAFYASGQLRGHHLAMTSMGTQHKAIVTPMYPAFPLEHALADRLEWAGNFRRPLVEAVVSYRSDLRVANLTLRMCLLPGNDEPSVLESSWAFDLAAQADGIQTFEDTVDGIAANPEGGTPINRRSGIVHFTEARQASRAAKWAISSQFDPADAVGALHQAIHYDLAFFH